MQPLLLIDSLSVGGAEYQAVTDANLLVNYGIPVTIGYFQDGQLRNKLSSKVNSVSLGSVRNINTFLAARRMCQERGIDLIHAHMWAANSFGAIMGYSLRVPIILTEHGLELWRTRKHIWIARLTYQIASRVYAVCEATRQTRIRCEGIAPDRISVMYNCFDLAHVFTGESRNIGFRQSLSIGIRTPVVGFIGRLHPVKRLDLLLEIAKLVLEKIPDTVFLLVGDGPEKGKIENLLMQRGLKGNFRLVGYQADIADFIGLMDVVAMTSEREALSMAILEAAASGVPAVGFAVGGNAEAIEHGKTGFIVPFGDVRAFSQYLVNLLSDAPLRLWMGQQAQKRGYVLFSPEVRLSSLLNVYAQLLTEVN